MEKYILKGAFSIHSYKYVHITFCIFLINEQYQKKQKDQNNEQKLYINKSFKKKLLKFASILRKTFWWPCFRSITNSRVAVITTRSPICKGLST